MKAEEEWNMNFHWRNWTCWAKGHDQWLQDVASNPTQNATNHEGDRFINWHKPPEEHILQALTTLHQLQFQNVDKYNSNIQIGIYIPHKKITKL